MRVLEGGLILLCLAALWYFAHDDLAEYAAFKLLTETADRQRRYRAWVLKSFLVFSGTSMLVLLVLGRLHALLALPPEFRPLSDDVRSVIAGFHIGSDFAIGMIGGMFLVGLMAGIVAMKRRANGRVARLTPDVEVLLPRNGPETAHAVLVALNAGLSEELFFRLAFPLLLTLLFGSAVVGFIAATAVFGGIHFYQGPAGILTTTMLGAVLAVLYLWTANLWIVVGAHAILDLFAFIARPAIARLFMRQ